MNNTVTVTVGAHDFEVSMAGNVASSQLVNGTVRDEARLAAADQFLSRRDLTRAEREYWAGVRMVSQEAKRFMRLN